MAERLRIADRFPYGKAPFWLCVAALISTALVVVTCQSRVARETELTIATFARPHYESYKRVLPAFERRHGVRVALQLVNAHGLQSRLQNAILAGADVPDLVELPTLAHFTRGPLKDVGLVDLTERLEREGYRQRMVESRFSMWSSRGRVFAVPHDVHPVMLAYRADIVEQLGIDVSELDTWDAFAAAGRRVVRDLDGDGVPDRYMIDLPTSAGWGITILLLQRGVGLFDAAGQVSFDDPLTVDTIMFYLEQTIGPNRIAVECGMGQPLMKAMTDGRALFYITPDWRSYLNTTDVPKLAGKLKLMPLPAWEPGGRRTTVWGGTGLAITKHSPRQDLAWELAKFLYFDVAELGKRFAETYIIPPFKDAWRLPQFQAENPFYSGQRLGAMYAELAAETPPQWGTAYNQTAENKLNDVFLNAANYYRRHGSTGLRAYLEREIADAARYIEQLMARDVNRNAE